MTELVAPELVALSTIDPQAVEHLLDCAFGSDRRGRTAYKLRAGTAAIPALSLAAVDGGRLVGSIQCWPVVLAGDDGVHTPMVLVGPVAVTPERQQGGVGRALMVASLAAAESIGLGDAMMLIGDPDYYARFFAFDALRTGGWRLPGPFERHRLLARGAGVPAGPGMVEPGIVVGA